MLHGAFHIYNGVKIVSRKKRALESREKMIVYGFKRRENVPEDRVISVNCGTCLKNSKSSYFAQRCPMMSQ